MLQAYVDDSGQHAESAVFVFAGFVSSAAQIDKFFTEWKVALMADPPIHHLKYTEAYGLSGQFHGWDHEKRNSKIEAMRKCANRNSVFSFSVIVPKLEFYRASDRIFPGRRKHWNPWVLAFSGVMKVVAEYQRRAGIDEEVSFIFDEQRQYGGKIQSTWEEFKSNCEPPRTMRSSSISISGT